MLEILGQTDMPVEKDQALNERHYGALQGLNKAEMAKKLINALDGKLTKNFIEDKYCEFRIKLK